MSTNKNRYIFLGSFYPSEMLSELDKNDRLYLQ